MTRIAVDRARGRGLRQLVPVDEPAPPRGEAGLPAGAGSVRPDPGARAPARARRASDTETAGDCERLLFGLLISPYVKANSTGVIDIGAFNNYAG